MFHPFKHRYSLIIFLMILFFGNDLSLVFAQELGAYSDYRDRFFIFDNGQNVKAEDMKVQ